LTNGNDMQNGNRLQRRPAAGSRRPTGRGASGYDRRPTGSRGAAGYDGRGATGSRGAAGYDGRGATGGRGAAGYGGRGATGSGAAGYDGRAQAGGRRPSGRAAQGRRGAGNRPVYGQPRRRGLSPRLRAGLLLGAAAIALVALGIGVARTVGDLRASSVERFLDNVYVNGVNLSGYTYEDGCALMAQDRDRRLNTTYALTYNGDSWGFKPADFGADYDYQQEVDLAWNLGHVGSRADRKQVADNLKAAPAQFNSEITYDEEALEGFVDELYDAVYQAPVDAEVAVTGTRPEIITASKNGVELDRERTQDNLVALIETGEGSTALPVEPLLPAVTSDNMEMKVVAKFATDVTFRGHDSRSNVALALSFFNGYVVYPGDTCDFNAVVGPRTIGRGFKEAPEYAGNEKVKGVGGGVCQASTTLYDAVLMANMTILERHNHKMTVSYVEPSQDAAVEYGTNGSDGKNFVFRNDTDHAIYIYTDVDKEFATVTIYGTRPEYHYQLESVVIDEQKSTRKRYEPDYSGKEVFYITDKPKLKVEGHGSCHSEGWLVAYDWDTKEEVSREQISYDSYVAGMNVYWRGVHDEKGNVVDPEAEKEEKGT